MLTHWRLQPIAEVDGHWLDRLIGRFCEHFAPYSFFNLPWNVKGLLAVILVSLICGAVGALVVGNRMAFFSDALAHCAFAGVTIGFLIFYAFVAGIRPDADFWDWTTPVMVIFGILVGLGIAWVRQQTGQASDTVIGVFFAGALGLAAVLKNLIFNRRYLSLEDFLFGNPTTVSASELLDLLFLAVLTAGSLAVMYNGLVFTSFNDSLARSRRIPMRLFSYLFIVLLALLVNLCLRTVGALLINALLIVPAATARNLAVNLRQMFWYTVLMSLGIGIAGVWLSWEVAIPQRQGEPIHFGIGGTIVTLSVLLFALSMLLGPWWRRVHAGRGLTKGILAAENGPLPAEGQAS